MDEIYVVLSQDVIFSYQTAKEKMEQRERERENIIRTLYTIIKNKKSGEEILGESKKLIDSILFGINICPTSLQQRYVPISILLYNSLSYSLVFTTLTNISIYGRGEGSEEKRRIR